MSIVERISLVTRNTERSDPLALETENGAEEGYESCGTRLQVVRATRIQFSPA